MSTWYVTLRWYLRTWDSLCHILRRWWNYSQVDQTWFLPSKRWCPCHLVNTRSLSMACAHTIPSHVSQSSLQQWLVESQRTYMACPEDPHKAQSFATTNSSFPVTTLASIQRLLSSAAWGRIPWIYLAGNQSWVLLLLPLFTSSLHHFLPLTWMDLLSKASFPESWNLSIYKAPLTMAFPGMLGCMKLGALPTSYRQPASLCTYPWKCSL
jgi:hypothetical protein